MELGDDGNEIVETVQNIFEIVTREFSAAAAGMQPGRWVGLDADGRARLAGESRAQMDRLKAIFDRVQCAIDSTACGDSTAAEVDAATAHVRASLAQRRAVNEKLRGLLQQATALAIATAQHTESLAR